MTGVITLLKITIFWDTTPCRQHDSNICQYISTRSNCVKPQTKAFFIVTTVRTLNLTLFMLFSGYFLRHSKGNHIGWLRIYSVVLKQWYSTWGTRTPGGTRRHLRGYVKLKYIRVYIYYFMINTLIIN
jgi:hypothetical protein